MLLTASLFAGGRCLPPLAAKTLPVDAHDQLFRSVDTALDRGWRKGVRTSDGLPVIGIFRSLRFSPLRHKVKGRDPPPAGRRDCAVRAFCEAKPRRSSGFARASIKIQRGPRTGRRPVWGTRSWALPTPARGRRPLDPGKTFGFATEVQCLTFDEARNMV